MDRGSTTLELSRSHVLPQSREDSSSIPMEVVAHTTTVALRMGMGMGIEETTVRTFQPSNTRQEGSKSHYLFQVREEWTLRHRVF